MKGKIYIIKNTINNKVYIGQTIQSIERRFNKHKSDYNLKKYDTKLTRAFNKYGIENFYIELLEENIEESLLDEKEIFWIKKYDSYNNGYNSTLGGQHKNSPSKYNRDIIKDLWDQGLSSKDIREKIKIPADTLSDILLHEFFIPKEEIAFRKGQKMYSFSDEKLLEYWEKGMGVFQISKKYGGSSSIIRKRLLRLGITEEELEQRAKENCGKNFRENNYNLQPVYQFDLNGKFIKQYKSIKEASLATNTERSSISKCISKEYKSANGYLWSNSNVVEKYTKPKDFKTVYQFDENFNLINEYESIAVVARAVGYKSPSSIGDVCRSEKLLKRKNSYWSFNKQLNSNIGG